MTITDIHYSSYEKEPNLTLNDLIYRDQSKFAKLPIMRWFTKRKIKWMVSWIENDVRKLNSGVVHRMKTIYELRMMSGNPTLMAQHGVQ